MWGYSSHFIINGTLHHLLPSSYLQFHERVKGQKEKQDFTLDLENISTSFAKKRVTM